MRNNIHSEEVEVFFEQIARKATGPGTIYITGGACAVLLGWRESTMDIDIKLLPEPAGIFQAIQDIKNSLHMNIELAAPDDFVPFLPGWQGRSLYICTKNRVDFYHYDFYGQALAKIERSHERDMIDVKAMLQNNYIEKNKFLQLIDAIKDDFIRYPTLDVQVIKKRVEALHG